MLPVPLEVVHYVRRVECAQHSYVVLEQVEQPDPANEREPNEHDRGEREPDFVCAKSLDAEQRDQDGYGDPHHSVCESGSASQIYVDTHTHTCYFVLYMYTVVYEL